MERPEINIVWFKRDFRLTDHAPLRAAVNDGRPALLCAFLEPSLIQQPQSADRHWRFVCESVADLRLLLPKGQSFYLFHEEVLPVFQQLAEYYTICHLYSHQETGLKVTYDRDRAVRTFCQARGISWREFLQDGVFRGLTNRRDWSERWETFVRAPQDHVDLHQLRTLTLPPAYRTQWAPDNIPQKWTTYQSPFQRGGPRYAHRYLNGFLQTRGKAYHRLLSKPDRSRLSCGRISPYLAFGNLSLRQAFQRSTEAAKRPGWARPMETFQSRLWWRSHYMQKLESEWTIEFKPINVGFSALRRSQDPDLIKAFGNGTTGFPMVDASVRCLQQNGWLNFRMRAMLATFATFALWLDWKTVAEIMARWFLDFEPGIHYAQIQMQSGMSGYHPLRIFSPVIQAQQHDPQGHFVRAYLPELKDVPAPQIYAPWTMTELEQQFYHCRIGTDYAKPIIDYETSVKKHRDLYWSVRQSKAVQQALPGLWERHCLPENITTYRKEWLSVS